MLTDGQHVNGADRSQPAHPRSRAGDAAPPRQPPRRRRAQAGPARDPVVDAARAKELERDLDRVLQRRRESAAQAVCGSDGRVVRPARRRRRIGRWLPSKADRDLMADGLFWAAVVFFVMVSIMKWFGGAL